MRYIINILVLVILFFGLSSYSSKKIKFSRSGASAYVDRDTTRMVLKKADFKLDIVRKLAVSFYDKKFEPIIMFSDDKIDFYYVGSDGHFVKKRLSDYAAVEELQDFLGKIDYIKYTMAVGVNEINEETIQTTLFYVEKDQIKSIFVFFVLNPNQNIKEIILK
jgi:hypothetical protein